MTNKTLLVPFVEVFSKAISFFNVLLFVRILPIQDYADYSYIIAIVLWSSVLMDGGINSLIYNNSLKSKTAGINELYTSRLFLSIFVIILIAIFFSIKSPELAISAIIFSFGAYFSTTSALVKMLSRGLGYTKVDILSILSEPLIRFFFLLFIYFTQASYNYSLWSVLMIYLLAGIIAFTINKHYLSIYFTLKAQFLGIWETSVGILNSVKQSKYYLLYYLLLIGLGRMDVIFIENYSDKIQLAIFSSALNIYQVAQLFFFSIITSQFKKLYNNKSLILKILVPLLLIAVVFTKITSPYIFEFLFPIKYYEGQFILDVLILAILPSVINFYFITNNNYENKTSANFVILSFVFLMKIVMYLVIKPVDGVTYGYGYLIAEIILLSFFVIKKMHENITNK